jgi:hypothetical protein
VVVPVYGCVGCIDEFVRRLTAALTDVRPRKWFSSTTAARMAPGTSSSLWHAAILVRAMRLSRNFGQHEYSTLSVLSSTGMSGLYVGEIFERVKGRPLFVVDERVSVDGADCPDPADTPESVQAFPRA